MYSTIISGLEGLDVVLSRSLSVMKTPREVDLQFELEDYSQEVLDKIVQCARKYLDSNFKPIVSIKADELKLKRKELEDFIDLEDELGKDKVGLFFSEDGENYTLDQTINAYLKCKDFAEYVKSTDTSPFEKYLMIYRFVTDRIYKDSDESVGKTRNLISILNSEEIVCVGYSKLLKFLCNEVGIYCETQTMDIFYDWKDEVGRHQNNIVYIKDDKYGIDGYYYADACWDSIKDGEAPYLKYTYALVPLSDIEKMKGLHFNFENTNFMYNKFSESELVVDAERLKSFASFMKIPLDEVSLSDASDEFLKQYNIICDYLGIVSAIFEKNNIPADMFSSGKFKKIPKRFYPEYFVSLLMLEPQRFDIIQKTIEEMKEFYKSGGKIDKMTEQLGLFRTEGCENIYDGLKEREYINDFADVMSIDSYYEIHQNMPRLLSVIEQMKASSVPVNQETFARAMINSCQAQGLTKEQAVRVTKIAFKRTMTNSKVAFNADASNCFVGEETPDLLSCLGE